MEFTPEQPEPTEDSHIQIHFSRRFFEILIGSLAVIILLSIGWYVFTLSQRMTEDTPVQHVTPEEETIDLSAFKDELDSLIETTTFTSDSPDPRWEVELETTYSCDGYDCYDLLVTCMGMNPQSATVRADHQSNAVGTILFTSGGSGVGYYSGDTDPNLRSSSSQQTQRMVQELYDAGYETYEIIYNGTYGWADANPGAGLAGVMCHYPAIAQWIHDEQASNPDVMCATGNSGGSGQIAFGLAGYNMEMILDVAVLTGGPPFADMLYVCLGENGSPRVSPTTEDIDHAFGWLDNGDYCQNQSGPEWVREVLLENDLSNPAAGWDYDYADTYVAFILGGNDDLVTVADNYYDLITSETTWQVLPGVGHGTHKQQPGPSTIANTLIEHCK